MDNFKLSAFFLLCTAFTAVCADAQSYDTAFVKPTKAAGRKSRKQLDSLAKTIDKSQTANPVKKKKENPIYFYRQHDGTLELHYNLGESIAVVFIYNNSADTLGRYELSGSGKKIIEEHMVGNKIYFYDLYISGKFIETKKVVYGDAEYSTKEKRLRENELNAPPP